MLCYSEVCYNETKSFACVLKLVYRWSDSDTPLNHVHVYRRGPLQITDISYELGMDTLSHLLFHVHYTDVIMTTIASQITSLTVVYSTVYSDADQRKHQCSASLAFVWGIHRDRWIPRTKGQLRGKCFHLMTSSWDGILHPYPNFNCGLVKSPLKLLHRWVIASHCFVWCNCLSMDVCVLKSATYMYMMMMMMMMMMIIIYLWFVARYTRFIAYMWLIQMAHSQPIPDPCYI